MCFSKYFIFQSKSILQWTFIFSFFLIYLFLFYMCVLPVCMSVYHTIQYLWRSEEGAVSSGTGVTKVVSHSVSVGNGPPVLCKRTSSPLKHWTSSLQLLNSIYSFLYCVSVYMHVCVTAPADIQNFQEWVSSFHCVSPGHQTQVIQLGALYPASQLIIPDWTEDLNRDFTKEDSQTRMCPSQAARRGLAARQTQMRTVTSMCPSEQLE